MFVHIHRIICKRGNMINDFVILCRDRGVRELVALICWKSVTIWRSWRLTSSNKEKKEDPTSTSWKIDTYGRGKQTYKRDGVTWEKNAIIGWKAPVAIDSTWGQYLLAKLLPYCKYHTYHSTVRALSHLLRLLIYIQKVHQANLHEGNAAYWQRVVVGLFALWSVAIA